MRPTRKRFHRGIRPIYSYVKYFCARLCIRWHSVKCDHTEPRSTDRGVFILNNIASSVHHSDLIEMAHLGSVYVRQYIPKWLCWEWYKIHHVTSILLIACSDIVEIRRSLIGRCRRHAFCKSFSDNLQYSAYCTRWRLDRVRPTQHRRTA